MDYSSILEQYYSNACIFSVDKYEDGTYGNILVTAGNSLFRQGVKELTGQPFVENTPYYYSLPKDLNFEDFIYRSAVLHQPLHTYVNLSQMGLWVEMYLLPLVSEKENTGYCLYTYTLAPKASEDNMSDLSPETSSRVLSACIKFRGSEDFPATINEITSDIRNICGSARCCILTIDKESETCAILGDASLPGFPSFLTSEEVRREFYKLIITWEDTIAGSSCLIIKNEQDMNVLRDRNPEWYRSLKEHYVESMVLFPLKHKNSLLGYIWATNFDINNAVKIKEVLEITTFFIASEIANYQMLKKLEILGMIDVLTGCLNRNAMNNRVTQFDLEPDETIKSVGVIFVDLNGLKQINDSDGHLEGDRSIKKAAAELRQVFYDDEIYRAGGDEFTVLVINSTQEEFNGKVQRIRNISQTQANSTFAIGSSFEEGVIDIRRALRRADEEMYENKKEYYLKHPEVKHR